MIFLAYLEQKSIRFEEIGEFLDLRNPRGPFSKHTCQKESLYFFSSHGRDAGNLSPVIGPS
jgi:hypothetical protein